MVAAIMSGERGVCEGWKCVHENATSSSSPHSFTTLKEALYVSDFCE